MAEQSSGLSTGWVAALAIVTALVGALAGFGVAAGRFSVFLSDRATFFDGAVSVLVLVILTALIWERFREPLNLFTGVLALATMALVYVSDLQWRTLDKTDETWRAGERAFVFLTHNGAGWQQAKMIDGEIVRLFPVVWENSGNSPTRNLVVELYCLPLWPLTTGNPTTLPTKPTLREKRLLGPKQTIWGGACNYPTSLLNLVKANGYHLYIAATADYYDIFDKHHWTEACFELINLSGTFEDLNVFPAHGINNCGRNCADEECEKP
jgi:hypothetical protein